MKNSTDKKLKKKRRQTLSSVPAAYHADLGFNGIKEHKSKPTSLEFEVELTDAEVKKRRKREVC